MLPVADVRPRHSIRHSIRHSTRHGTRHRIRHRIRYSDTVSRADHAATARSAHEFSGPVSMIVR